MPNQKVIFESQVDGEFSGFNEMQFFKLSNGTYWLQDEYKYLYYYFYCPRVSIVESQGTLFLNVEGITEWVKVRQVAGVIESYIEGTFKGWDGNTTYKLTNGQVWTQTQYRYQYKYAYRPKAYIYKNGGSYFMSVAGTYAKVRRA